MAYELSEMYNQNTPALLICIWVASVLCCITVLVLTGVAIKQHVQGAKAHGFGRQALMRSYGPRADRIIKMLLVQPVFALTAVMQVFLPKTQLLVTVLRTCYFAYAGKCLIDLFVLMSGGQTKLLENLPSEPIAVWGAPPFCCCFGWSCCKRKVKSFHLQVYMAGVTQFMIFLPLVSVFELYYATLGAGSEDVVFAILFAVSTLWGLWSIKSLMGPVSQAIPTSEKSGKSSLSHMGHAFLLQIALTKMPDKILVQVIPRIMKDGWRSGEFFMPPIILAVVLEGLVLCVGMLVLSFLAIRKDRVANETMYPSPDPAQAYPRDAMTLIEMNGLNSDSVKAKIVPAQKPGDTEAPGNDSVVTAL